MWRWIVGLSLLGTIGCASGGVFGRQPDVVVIGDDRYPDDRDYPDDDYPDRRRGRGRGGDDGEYGRGRGRGRGGDDGYYGYRSIRVPPGHYPPPGACRVWYPDRPPGHQPPPVRCDRLYGRSPYGAFILYNRRAWDSDYDWVRHERRYRNSVPRVILRIVGSRRR
jgi:hypothetical protein